MYLSDNKHLVDTDKEMLKIVISNKVSVGKKGFKYQCQYGYQYVDKIIPLGIQKWGSIKKVYKNRF